MQHSAFPNWETELSNERSRKHIGSASISLDVLDNQHQVDEDNVKRLVKVLQSGCDRTDIRNHIIAIIDEQDLDLALSQSNLLSGDLVVDAAGSFPVLNFPPGFRLQCLHGVDRIAAARKVLPSGDQRWVVDLYLADISPNLRLALIDSYCSEKDPSDGEIYTKIRQYQLSGDTCLEGIWWARLAALSVQKKKNLTRILRSHDYLTAFDCQIKMPGLQVGMKLGTMHTILSMRCDEENVRYLRYITNTWTAIFSNDSVAMQKLDSFTVKELELTAPGYCRQDAVRLYRKLQQGQIFKYFNSSERECIWKKVLSVSADRLIPSLQTFFDDVKYLQVPAECVKRLAGHEVNGTTVRSLKCRYTDNGQTPRKCIFQLSETKFEARLGDLDVRREVGYRTVWICAMRNCLEISAKENKKGRRRLAKTSYRDDETVDCRFGSLAYRVGFESQRIYELIHRSADREIARSALLRARNPKYYSYSVAEFDTYVDKIVDLFNAASETSDTSIQQPTDSEPRNEDELPNRSGLPKLHHYMKDQKTLFLDTLHSKVADSGIIDHFFVRRSVYLAFFGHLKNSIGQPTELKSRSMAEGQDIRDIQTNNISIPQDKRTKGDAKHVQHREATRRILEQEAAAATKRIHEREAVASQRILEREEAAAKRIREEEEEAKRVQHQEATRRILEQEAAAKRIQEQETAAAQRIRELEEVVAKRIREGEETAAKMFLQESVKRIEDQERIQQKEAAQRIQEQQAAAQRIQEIEVAKRIQEQKTLEQIQQEEATKRMQEEQAAAQRIQEIEVAKRIQEQRALERTQQEEAAAQRIQEQQVPVAAAEIIQVGTAASARAEKLGSSNRVTQIGIDQRENMIRHSRQETAVVTSSPLPISLPENDQTQTSFEKTNTSEYKRVRSLIPQKRKNGFITGAEGRKKHDQRETIEVLEENNGEWVVKFNILASPHHKWNAETSQRDTAWTLRDSAGKQLCEETCFEDVIQDGTCKIYLVPKQEQSPQRLNATRIDQFNLGALDTSNWKQGALTPTRASPLEVQTKEEMSSDSDEL